MMISKMNWPISVEGLVQCNIAYTKFVPIEPCDKQSLVNIYSNNRLYGTQLAMCLITWWYL